MDVLKEFLSEAYSTLDGVTVVSDLETDSLLLETSEFEDIIRVSKVNDIMSLTSDYYGKEYICGDSDYCIDAYVMSILGAYRRAMNCAKSTETEVEQPSQRKQQDLCADEIDEVTSEEEHSFSRLNIENIVSDLSVVVISKLVFEDSLIGYRFRLNNGCLDISIEKGKELGIVPYKIGKRVQLQAVNGVLASKYEVNNKVLFPDISSDSELCATLLKELLS